MPQSSGSGLNAPRGCLSKPTTSATSAAPETSIAWAVVSAVPPVAQPFLTLMNGTPVKPEIDTDVSALPAASDPPAAKSTSCQAMPASASARAGGDRAHLEARTRRRGGRTGWMPSADDRDVVVAAHSSSSTGRNANVSVPRRPGDRDQRQLHRHADAQPGRIALGQPRLDADLAGQLDVADAVGLELLDAALEIRRRLGREALDRPGPQRAARRQLGAATSSEVQRGHDAGAGRSPCHTVRTPSRSASAPARCPPISSGSISCR